MVRSFSDRVFGGVCGGLAASLRLNAWLVRALFIVLALVSLGAFAVLYLLLWWLVPQESAVLRRGRRGVPLPLVLLMIALTLLAWAGRDMGYLRLASGVDMFWPGMLLLLSAVFFLRQVRV
jgi:phage shock protein PspC (stress-responsive transcriptional regulator)